MSWLGPDISCPAIRLNFTFSVFPVSRRLTILALVSSPINSEVPGDTFTTISSMSASLLVFSSSTSRVKWSPGPTGVWGEIRLTLMIGCPVVLPVSLFSLGADSSHSEMFTSSCSGGIPELLNPTFSLRISPFPV